MQLVHAGHSCIFDADLTLNYCLLLRTVEDSGKEFLQVSGVKSCGKDLSLLTRLWAVGIAVTCVKKRLLYYHR